MESICTFSRPLCRTSCNSRNILCMCREILEKLLFKNRNPKMLSGIRCQRRTHPTSLGFFLLHTHCTFEKCIHTVNLSVCSISLASTHSTEDLFFLLLPISHSHQPSTQRSNLKLLYCKLQFLSISKGRDFAIEPGQVIILLYLRKELREIYEFQVSNLTSNLKSF